MSAGDALGDNGADPDDPMTYPAIVDDPTLADLEYAMAEADEQLARALELEAQAWEYMQGCRLTVAQALEQAQYAQQRYKLLRANARPAR